MMNPIKCFEALLLIVVLSFVALSEHTSAQKPPMKKRDPAHEEELCRNFTIGQPRRNEFYSPLYPSNYPPGITCFRVITADVGYFVRIDFREIFLMEPNIDCEYDFLEVRDGDQGYSPLIGKYCGENFPPLITSSGRSLWLRFRSDSTAEYRGFKAVFSYISNPLGHMPDIGKCSFEAGGYQDFIGSLNISSERIEHSLTYGAPIDCVWTIRTEESFKLYIQFPEYELSHPNDCHLNYLQVYDGKTDEENLLKKFCGSVAESTTSISNVVYIRFYAEKSAIKSKFSCVITAIRTLVTGSSCDPVNEYDCDDATCIHPDLVCNSIRNCKLGWDEESCKAIGTSISMDFTATHVILILVVLSLILLGMFAGMCCNLYRKLSADKEEIQKSMASSINRAGDPDTLTVDGIHGAPVPILALKLRNEGRVNSLPAGNIALNNQNLPLNNPRV